MNGLFLYLLIILIPLIASANIKKTYSKYSRVQNDKSLTGFDVARRILDANGMNKMYIVEVPGELTDHYDPKQKVVRLSTDIYHNTSVASLAVAAHECGHAIQDNTGYTMMKIRSKLCPVVNFITYSAYILFAISAILQAFSYLKIAAISVLAGLLFQIVTLPVEFNASNRALKQIEELGLVSKEEKKSAYKVLKAAALTYVAAVLSSLINLLRIVMSISSNDRR